VLVQVPTAMVAAQVAATHTGVALAAVAVALRLARASSAERLATGAGGGCTGQHSAVTLLHCCTVVLQEASCICAPLSIHMKVAGR
jgi:hypothetical protein